MEGKDNFKIDKLVDSNFHVWKQKVELVLGDRGVTDHILDTSTPDDPLELAQWKKDDAKAKAVIGLTLSNDLLEHVRGLETAFEMWEAILNLFQRRTLLNSLTARRRFYSVKMNDGERALTFISRVRQLASDLKAMDVKVEDDDIAMTVLCGLPPKYEHLIVAIDAAKEDSELTFDFVKSRLLQEEQRLGSRVKSEPKGDSALITDTKKVATRKCDHCGKPNHTEANCWQKYPDKRPKPKGLVSKVPEGGSSEGGHVCLMTKATRPEASVTNASKAEWVIDSGASGHMSPDKSVFADLSIVEPFDVTIGDTTTLKACGRGNVELNLCINGKLRTCTISDALFVPSLGYNLLSVSVMDKAGCIGTFGNGSCHIERKGVRMAEGTMRDGLYYLSTHHDTTRSSKVAAALTVSLDVWHQRLAHVHTDGIRDMVRKNVVKGINTNVSEKLPVCEGCVHGKSTRASVPKQGGERASGLLHLVHTDVCSFPEESHGGSKYFVTFVDDYTRFSWVYSIAAKSDVFQTFKRWKTMVENQFDVKLKVLQSDNGGEYVSDEMGNYLEDNGIVARPTTPHNPHQNGVAERLNRTLTELIRSMLHQKGLEKSFWAEALAVAVHVRNRVTTHSLKCSTTPYEMLYHRKPDMSYLRVFGCRCWYTLPKNQIDKLDPRAQEAIMIGYARGRRGYKLWDIDAGKVVVSRDVRFDELSKPEASHGDSDSDASEPPPLPMDDGADVTTDKHEGDGSSDDVANGGQSDDDIDEVAPAQSPEPDSSDDSDSDENQHGSAVAPGPRRSNRTRQPPGDWWKANVALLSNAQTAHGDPKSFRDAMYGPNGPLWVLSMDLEYKAHVKNGSWVLVPRPPGANVLRSKWVYKTKEEQKADGLLGIRHKSRICAVGLGQVLGIDYTETYAPVVKLVSIRILLSITAAMDLLLHNMDVVTAFLNGDLDELVYMEQPRGYEKGNPRDVVCLLKKSICGLKQSPRQWYAKIDELLCSALNMQHNDADDCLYVRKTGKSILLIALYVDDLLIACSDESTLLDTKRQLSQRFEMKDLGESRVILNMDISRNRPERRLSLCQARYAQKVIERFGMGAARGQDTPMEGKLDLTVPTNPVNQPYREAIGSLMYLMVGTRPDIGFAVCNLSKYAQNPGQAHWDAVKRVLRYLIKTKDLGICFGQAKDNRSLVPHVYVDSDWAQDPETRRSMSGNVVMMGGAAIAWNVRQQEVVALSSAESEYIGLCLGVKETVWIRRLVSGLGLVDGVDAPTTVLLDNQASDRLAHNASINRRTKHIDVRYHYTRKAIEDKVVKLEYCPTEEMVADMLTKPLGRVKLQNFVASAGLTPSESASRQ